MSNLALNVRAVLANLIKALVKLVLHPDLLTVLAVVAAVWAANRQWGFTGALWMFAGLAALLALANARAAA